MTAASEKWAEYTGVYSLATPTETSDSDEHVGMGALGILTRAELADLPPIVPLLDDTLDRRSMAVLAGYWSVGKSFVALDWACSVATGYPWFSRQVDDAGGCNRVLYIVAEGAHGVHERIRAWETEHERFVEDLFVMPRPVNLLDREAVARLVAVVGWELFDLVIIDTLSRCMPGADENSAKDMSTAVESLDRIKNAQERMSPARGRRGTCVVAVHHTGKDRSTIRGSSVLEAAADTVYQVDGDGQQMRLERTKRKDGPREDVHHLAIRWVSDTDSACVRTLGVTDRLQNADRLLSAYLSAFGGTGASKADLRKIVEMPPASFHRALNVLVSERKLINTGTDKRPFYKPGDDT